MSELSYFMHQIHPVELGMQLLIKGRERFRQVSEKTYNGFHIENSLNGKYQKTINSTMNGDYFWLSLDGQQEQGNDEVDEK